MRDRSLIGSLAQLPSELSNKHIDGPTSTTVRQPRALVSKIAKGQ